MKSIHLENFPKGLNFKPNSDLISDMSRVRAICSAILSLRKDNNIKVRIPLANVTVYGENLAFLTKYKDVILDETNIKNINFNANISSIGSEVLQINFKTLGAKMGKDLQKIISEYKAGNYQKVNDNTMQIAEFKIEKPDFSNSFQAKNNTTTKFCDGCNCAVEIDTNITEELEQEGIMRDFIRLIQQDRKLSGFNIMDKISIFLNTQDVKVKSVIEQYSEYISSQCLINSIEFENKNTENLYKYLHEINNSEIIIFLQKNV